MSLDNPKPSVDAVSEYLVSGHPWVTSSLASGVVGHDFALVTQFVNVKHTSGSGNIRVGFTENGIRGANYYLLKPNESLQVDVKCKSLYISGSGESYSIIAGLTGISRREMVFLTGSIGYTGVG